MKTWQRIAEERGIPLRTLEQVTAALAQAKKQNSDKAMARMMVRNGRLTDEAREYVAKYVQ
jgi:hypothetical protein